MIGSAKATCVLIFRRVYDAPVERVWRALTEASELGQWFLAGDDHVVLSSLERRLAAMG